MFDLGLDVSLCDEAHGRACLTATSSTVLKPLLKWKQKLLREHASAQKKYKASTGRVLRRALKVKRGKAEQGAQQEEAGITFSTACDVFWVVEQPGSSMYFHTVLFRAAITEQNPHQRWVFLKK